MMDPLWRIWRAACTVTVVVKRLVHPVRVCIRTRARNGERPGNSEFRINPNRERILSGICSMFGLVRIWSDCCDAQPQSNKLGV
jgi:hypothetical protein